MQAAIFPGQGAQRPGMGQDLFGAFPAARSLFRRADEILEIPLSDTCFKASPDIVNRTDICQPGIFLVSAATMVVLRERHGVAPGAFHAAAGLSLGEYTALWFAGAFTFEDALILTRLRGRLMQEASEAQPSGMTSILGLDTERTDEICAEIRSEGGVVCVANLNSPGQVVISGAKDALEKAAARLLEVGARRAIPLPVAGAFHSPLMTSAAERLKGKLDETEIRAAALPVISNVTAKPVRSPAEIRENLVRQLSNPVLWELSMRHLLKEGCSKFVEPGPGTVLSGLMRKIDRNVSVKGYPDAAAIEEEEGDG